MIHLFVIDISYNHMEKEDNVIADQWLYTLKNASIDIP
jgi:hypothetical protein